MPSTFTVRNTGNTHLEVQRKGEQGQADSGGGGGPAAQPKGQGQGQGQGQGGGQDQGGGQTLEADLRPGEERSFTVDKNSHVQIRAGEEQQAQPKR